MALSFDAATTILNGGSGTSLSGNHVNAGNVIFAYLCIYNNGSAVVDPTTFTFDGVPFTLLTTQAANGPQKNYLYYLVAPSIGTKSVAITFASANTETNLDVASYIGMGKKVPTVFNSGTGASPRTLSVTTPYDNSWLIGGFASDQGSTVSASTGTTFRTSTARFKLGDSNGAKSPVGSYSMAATVPAGNIAGIVAAFSPYLGEQKQTLVNQSIHRSNYY